jgi:hypothetical protein
MMDVVSLAMSQITSQLALEQGRMQVSMMRQEHSVQTQMVNMLAASTQAAPAQSGSTGQLLNVYA